MWEDARRTWVELVDSFVSFSIQCYPFSWQLLSLFLTVGWQFCQLCRYPFSINCTHRLRLLLPPSLPPGQPLPILTFSQPLPVAELSGRQQWMESVKSGTGITLILRARSQRRFSRKWMTSVFVIRGCQHLEGKGSNRAGESRSMWIL